MWCAGAAATSLNPRLSRFFVVVAEAVCGPPRTSFVSRSAPHAARYAAVGRLLATPCWRCRSDMAQD
ncbi:hypothetical protein RR42_s2261 [Cupriavidus basilensis]|uniref:Uncharacterized protein n=1 Tax=Cupriavidus basilensis TaxID=68895 RepID=A0A0C4YL91_9BURK|nr:hypothetical protein RR42_s2261 [Cupriavidus basilensis]